MIGSIHWAADDETNFADCTKLYDRNLDQTLGMRVMGSHDVDFTTIWYPHVSEDCES
jgi:hypothetical protein